MHNTAHPAVGARRADNASVGSYELGECVILEGVTLEAGERQRDQFLEETTEGSWLEFDKPLFIPLGTGTGQVRLQLFLRGADSGKLRRFTITYFDRFGSKVAAPTSAEFDSSLGPIAKLLGAGSFPRERSIRLDVPSRAAAVVLECADPVTGFEFLPSRSTMDLVPTAERAVSDLVHQSKLGIILIDSPFGFLGTADELLHHRLLVEKFVSDGYGVIYMCDGAVEPGVAIPGCLQSSRKDFDRLVSVLPRSSYWIGGVPSARQLTSASLLHLLGWQVEYESLDAYDFLSRKSGIKWYNPGIERKIASVASEVYVPNDGLEVFYDSFLGSEKNIRVAASGSKPARETADKGTGRIEYLAGSLVGTFLMGPHRGSTAKFLRETADAMPDIEFEALVLEDPAFELPANVSVKRLQPQELVAQIIDAALSWRIAVAPLPAGGLSYSDGNTYVQVLADLGLPVIYLPKHSRQTTEFAIVVDSQEAVAAEIRKAAYESKSAAPRRAKILRGLTGRNGNEGEQE